MENGNDKENLIKDAFERVHARLGIGVRACQLCFVVLFLGALGYACATAPADFAYDFSFVHGFAVCALSSVCIWMFQL